MIKQTIAALLMTTSLAAATDPASLNQRLADTGHYDSMTMEGISVVDQSFGLFERYAFNGLVSSNIADIETAVEDYIDNPPAPQSRWTQTEPVTTTGIMLETDRFFLTYDEQDWTGVNPADVPSGLIYHDTSDIDMPGLWIQDGVSSVVWNVITAEPVLNAQYYLSVIRDRDTLPEDLAGNIQHYHSLTREGLDGVTIMTASELANLEYEIHNPLTSQPRLEEIADALNAVDVETTTLDLRNLRFTTRLVERALGR